MVPLFAQLDLTDPAVVIETLRAAAAANRSAPCRRGSIDVIHPPGMLIATGDLHDNPLHLARLAAAAGLGDPDAPPRAHLTLHEVIHPDRLVNGMDFSFRALTRIAALKAAHPGHVHTLLANHELAQIIGSGIVKDGVRVVEAFNEGVAYAFGDAADGVLAAIGDFIRSMPLALVCHPLPEGGGRGVGSLPLPSQREGPGVGSAAAGAVKPPDHTGRSHSTNLFVPSTPSPPTPQPPPSERGSILCAHSLPPPELMSRFDPAILERDMTEEDYTPRQGSAHLMVWGRGHTPDHLRALADRWSVDLFILGHEKADTGVFTIQPNTIVLNSDHERGVYLPIDLGGPPTLAEAVASVVPLAG